MTTPAASCMGFESLGRASQDLTGSEQRGKWSVNPDWHELHTTNY